MGFRELDQGRQEGGSQCPTTVTSLQGPRSATQHHSSFAKDFESTVRVTSMP